MTKNAHKCNTSKGHLKHPRIIFLNQMVVPVFGELIEDISKELPPALLFTGFPEAIKGGSTDSLNIIAAPKYCRESDAGRILSWMKYFVYVLWRCWRQWRGALLFMSSNPPFMGIIGYLLKRLRGQHYVILIYDIYPDILVQFGRLKQSGSITRLWRRANRMAWENADAIFTISEQMAGNLERWFDARKTPAGRVIAIPNWADIDRIRPVAKDKNDFARKYNQVQKLTVMYAGNLGQTHDIETMLDSAKKLKENDDVHFMIIGGGAKKNLVEKTKHEYGLDNLTVLPFQPENILPDLLSTGDLAVISLDKGSEGLMVPSKTYSAMAAGSALIGLCDNNSEVARIINHHQCGIVVSPGDVDGMVSGIMNLFGDRAKLNYYRANSRSAAEKFYSRKNTSRYLEVLSTILSSQY